MTVDTTYEARRVPPKFINKVVVVLLRSPLHGLVSKALMLLTYRGRKSGKMYTIPVGYTRRGETLTLFTDHNWWKNLRGQAPVMLRLRGKKLQGTAEVIHDDTELIAEGLMAFVQQHPRAAPAYEVKLDTSGQPDRASAQRAAQHFTLIRIHLV
ncbi:MAG: nitroreductase family deazaflavin-dependent oxidoreductase [Chloroflexota bacterium]|nr:nitroreductase family deazaflavin-dependent oxidoreductase [Chloroflexota bacterium]